MTASTDTAAKPQDILKQYWGYDAFRPLQREAIDCVIGKRDSVVVLPTGGGKSLCYQIPALCTEQIAVVVSPLISLMKDQVDGLVASGIAAASINSSMSEDEKRSIAQRMRSGELRMLYLAPERLVQPATIRFLQEIGVAFFAIDEAHCISSWGHDFRPEYRQLSKLKEQFPTASVHAFTATATERVRADIAKQLNLSDAELLVGSFDRPNLNYRVHRRSDVVGQMREIIDRHPQQSGIVYCISRKEVENVAATLNSSGYKAKPYHAGLNAEERSQHQDDFINERTDIIVATVAFGMGIDKSNVRYVIHTGMPKSLEAYQQESGRAGRDGLQSECTLIFSGGDYGMWLRMMDGPSGKELLNAMYSYCTRSTCRHAALVEYFGQTLDSSNCGACDFCLGELKTVEGSLVISQKIISCVHRVDQRFGVGHVAKVLSGSAAQRILELGHDKLSTYGLLAEHNARSIMDWIEQLIGHGHLQKSGEYNVLTITESGREVLRGELTPDLYDTAPPKKRAAGDDWEGVDRPLFEALRALRVSLAQEREIPPFVVFHDASLRDMARQRPSTTAAFGKIQGVGEKKLADYGDSFVNCIAQHCQENELALDQQATGNSSAAPKQSILVKAKQDAFALFEAGESVEQVASKIDRANGTTSGYLAEFIQLRSITDPTPWVEAPIADQIRAAAAEVGSLDRLGPIKTILGEDFSYEQIRVVIECLKVETGFVEG